MGTRFLIPSSPDSAQRSPTLMGADSLWIALKFLWHANHLCWELLTERIGACSDSSSLCVFVHLYACVKEKLSSLASLILFGPHKACAAADLYRAFPTSRSPTASPPNSFSLLPQRCFQAATRALSLGRLITTMLGSALLSCCSKDSAKMHFPVVPVLETLTLLCPSLPPVLIPRIILDRGETLMLGTRAEEIPECLQGGPCPWGRTSGIAEREKKADSLFFLWHCLQVKALSQWFSSLLQVCVGCTQTSGLGVPGCHRVTLPEQTHLVLQLLSGVLARFHYFRGEKHECLNEKCPSLSYFLCYGPFSFALR